MIDYLQNKLTVEYTKNAFFPLRYVINFRAKTHFSTNPIYITCIYIFKHTTEYISKRAAEQAGCSVSDFVFCAERRAFFMADHKGLALASTKNERATPSELFRNVPSLCIFHKHIVL